MMDAESANSEINSTQILQALPDAVLVIDQQNRIVCWNGVAAEISGYRADEMLGKECPEGLLQNFSQFALDTRRSGSELSCSNDDQRRELVTYIRHRDGHLVPVLAKLSPVTQGNEVVATVAQLSDMTPRAMHDEVPCRTTNSSEWVDTVTLLPSMLASTAQLRESFERWKLTGERFSVMLVSVRDLQLLEQQHGADTVERLFIALAKTLGGTVRQTDFVGCWMEEQFIVLLPHCSQPQARNAGKRLLPLLAQTTVCHHGEYITARFVCAVTSVRANDTPATILERIYQEMKRKAQVEQPTSARTLISFHQQRPM